MDMMQLYLVEEREFASDRMAQHTTASLPNPQVVLAVPFRNEALLLARLLDHAPVVCLKEARPAHIQSVREVAHVHQPQFLAFLPHRSTHLLLNCPPCT